ncbi:hypothetical protein [Actinoplanes sp. NPDC051851]|uniref:fibronectin type III domain-containing protein n=1 Tax=Actinoplanes sp. NPDC051851 TaxID=3154753 RepID=UPI00343B354F
MRKCLTPLTLLAAAVIALPGAAVAAPRRAAIDPLPLLPPTAYIGSAMSASSGAVLDATAGTVTEVPGAYGTGITRAVLAPDVPVAYWAGQAEVLRYDRQTAAVTTFATLPGSNPYPSVNSTLMSPDGRWLYVADSNANTIYKFDTTGVESRVDIPVTEVGMDVAANADVTRLYVPEYGDNHIYMVDTATNQVSTDPPLDAGFWVTGFARSPDGAKIFAWGDEGENQVAVIDTAANTITPAFTVPAGTYPLEMAYSPDGRSIFAATYESSGDVVLRKYDATSYEAQGTLTTGSYSVNGMAFNPNGTALYLTAVWPGAVYPVDLTTGDEQSLGTIGQPITLTNSPGPIVFGGVMVPGAPTITAAALSSGQATISFVDGADGGDPISGRTVTWSGGSQSCPSSPCTVAGLTGSGYSFTMHATNQRGDSLESAPAVVGTTPSTSGPSASVPDAPEITSAVASDGQVTLRFQDGAGNGSAITGHMVNFDGGPRSCPPSVCVITGLTNGVGYTFTVQAVNAIGNSVPSDPSDVVTPSRLPGAPKITGLRLADGTVTVGFTPPAGPNDTPIEGYQYAAGSGAWIDLDDDATIENLEPGRTHSIRLRAVNGAGAGPASAPVTVTIPAVTGQPSSWPAPTVVAGVSSTTVTWTKPTAQGVTGYTVRAKPGPATCTTSAGDTSCVIGGTAGKPYTFTVTARGVSGVVSPASKVVTPRTPGLPSALPDDTEAVLTTTKGRVTTATRGQTMTLVGRGFAAYSTVRVVIYGKGRLLATPVTDATGQFSTKITVPSVATGRKHSLMAAGVDPDGGPRRISMTFTVKKD